MSKNTVPVEQEVYLEIDDRIPGQNYVCMSFISPEETLIQSELFKFNKYMLQVCKDFEDIAYFEPYYLKDFSFF